MARKEFSREDCDVVVAFLGAPNAGKTTLFNTITGKQELVANWPGATVTLSTAIISYRGKSICIVDLPGVYSISGDRADERVARDFIMKENPDVVVVLVDPASIERSLSLALEVLEAFGKTVVAITKADMLEKKGVKIDTRKMSEMLGAPVVLVSALEEKGIRDLLDRVLEVASKSGNTGLVLDYGDLEQYIREITGLLVKAGIEVQRARWYAIKLLEGDQWVEKELSTSNPYVQKAIERARKIRAEYELEKSRPLVADIIAAKYDYASKIVEAAVKGAEENLGVEITRVDLVFMHPLAGPLVSLGILIGIFFAAFAINIGFPLTTILDYAGLHGLAATLEQYTLSSLLDQAFSLLADYARTVIADPVTASLVADGIIGGVGSVLTFLPLIVIVFFFMALLEDSGLLTRIALSFDGVFSKFGLPGKTVFPVMVSMGCNVPGVMATRIIEDENQRRAAILALPLIPCQARLYVILALTSVFLASPLEQALTTTGIYLLSILLFLLSARLFYVILGGGEEEIVLEQVPLKKPSMKIVGWLVWDKAKHFVIKAGTIIFAMSIVLWLLVNVGPTGFTGDPAQSFAASIGHAIAPAISTVFGVDRDTAWRLGVGFLNGFIAKEVFVETLAMLSPIASQVGVSLAALQAYHLTVAQVIAILVAATLYIPCMATIAVMYRELGSAKLASLGVAYSLVLATIAAWLSYLVLSWLGF